MRKRWLSIALTAAMAATMISGTVFASEEAETEEETYGEGVDVNDDGTVNNPEAVTIKEGYLSFWSLFTGGDGEWWNSIVDQYNSEKDPTYPIQSITLVWDDYYTKLQTAVATGNGPDAGISHVSKLYELAETGVIEPLTPYLEELGIDLADYYTQESIDAVTIDGDVYAIPLDTHAEVLYYNLDLLEEAGITEDDVKAISSADDFTALLQKCKDALPEDVTPLSITQSGDDPFRMWYADYFQAGGTDFVNEDATECTIDDEVSKKVLEWQKSLYDDGLVLEGISDHQALFQQGKAAFVITGTWASGVFEQTDGLNFGNTVYPQLFDGGDKQYCWADSHTLVLPVNEDRTDEESTAVVQFLFSASNDYGLTWAGSGQIPAAVSVNQSDDYKAMKGYNVVDELQYAKYAPRATNYYGGMKADMIDALNAYWTGDVDLDTAEENIVTAIEDNLD
ncbi:MAG: extracellular solute-binding protein [Lachnospiraceae bacterium]|jgi:multiple sugar transport system substrate-binding protein